MYDAIVVGARCAGSPTAMLLARMGYRVLLLDKAGFPSDTLSTHVVHPRASAALARWRLLDRLTATGCPPLVPFFITTPGSEGKGGKSARSTGASKMLPGSPAGKGTGGTAASLMLALLLAAMSAASNRGSSPGAQGSIAPSFFPIGSMLKKTRAALPDASASAAASASPLTG